MTSFKSWCFLFLLPFSVFAESTVVEGVAPELAGMVIQLTVQKNPLSAERIELASDTIDEAGNFQLSCEINKVEAANIAVNRFSSVIYLEPGKTYKIEIPKSKWFILIWSWNTGELEYNFTDLEENDVNAEILAFDSQYYNFFGEFGHLLGSKTFRQELRKFESIHLNQDYSTKFSSDHARYSIAEIKMSTGINRDSLYSEYLEARSLNLMNPAVRRFFFLFYKNNMARYELNTTEQNTKDNALMSFEELDSSLVEQPYLNETENRHWILLESLDQTAFFGDSLTRIQTVEILKDFETASKSEQIKKAIKETRQDTETFPSQNLHEIFTPILNVNIDKKKPTFILVSLGRSKDRDKESLVLESLLEDYGDYFQVVELTIGGGQRSKALWPIIDILAAQDLMKDLLIFKLPWYGWMEPDGSLTKDINKPSEGLEERLYSIRAKVREEQKIKVGQ